MRGTPLRGFIGRLIGVSLICALALGGGSSLVTAGGAPPAENIATDQTMAQSVVALPPPPAGFHPLSASAAELETYFYPPRPDARSAPTAYARWKKLVLVPRVGNPKLQQTTIYNGPVQHLSNRKTLSNGTVSTASLNWSGYAIVGPSGTFISNHNFIYGEWVVPRAQQAFGVCDGGWDYSSQWDGFDGVTSNDVLQAGTEADAYCSGSTQASEYFAWIEWAPAPAISVSPPAVRPGDLIDSEVWYLSNTFGLAYIVNYTLQQAQVYGINAPAGYSLTGDSVEWVVERPFVQSAAFTGLANLTNYAADQFNVDVAATSNTYFLPGASPAGTTTLAISMACPPWNPSSSCPFATIISTPSLYPPWALWFYDSPPAL